MPKIIKDKAVVDDNWEILAKDSESYADNAHAVLPLSLWLKQDNRSSLAVWLDSDESAADIDTDLQSIPLIAVNFPAFADGRGFSFARELRDKGYKGEIRAIGAYMRDQLYYLNRCGFTSFASDAIDLEAALNSFNDFTVNYQASTDQSKPVFTR